MQIKTWYYDLILPDAIPGGRAIFGQCMGSMLFFFFVKIFPVQKANNGCEIWSADHTASLAEWSITSDPR